MMVTIISALVARFTISIKLGYNAEYYILNCFGLNYTFGYGAVLVTIEV